MTRQPKSVFDPQSRGPHPSKESGPFLPLRLARALSTIFLRRTSDRERIRARILGDLPPERDVLDAAERILRTSP